MEQHPLPAWPKYGPTIKAELTELVELIDYRAAVMDEALAQLTDIVHYWSGMLMFSQASHPWTFRLAQVAVEVGAFVVFQYKMRYNRPRPSQLCPWLMPPVAVPPHASFPSGHSTQGHLLSGLLREVLPAQVTRPDRTRPYWPEWQSAWRAIAKYLVSTTGPTQWPG